MRACKPIATTEETPPQIAGMWWLNGAILLLNAGTLPLNAVMPGPTEGMR